jgi:hypothetical protein
MKRLILKSVTLATLAALAGCTTESTPHPLSSDPSTIFHDAATEAGGPGTFGGGNEPTTTTTTESTDSTTTGRGPGTYGSGH